MCSTELESLITQTCHPFMPTYDYLCGSGCNCLLAWTDFNTHNGDRPTHAIIMTDLWNNTRSQRTHMGNIYIQWYTTQENKHTETSNYATYFLIVVFNHSLNDCVL